MGAEQGQSARLTLANVHREPIASVECEDRLELAVVRPVDRESAA